MIMEKKEYLEPSIEVVTLDEKDVITMSNEVDLKFPGEWLGGKL